MYAWSLLKDEELDLEKFQEKRQELIAEHKKIKEIEHDPLVRKKYGHFCIDMPLRTIFKKNLPDKKK